LIEAEFVGEWAPLAERISDQRLIALTLDALRSIPVFAAQFADNDGTTEHDDTSSFDCPVLLVRTLVSSWQRDPLARGAYIDTGRNFSNSQGSESDSDGSKVAGEDDEDDADEREAWRFVRLCEPVDSQPSSSGAATALGRAQLVSHPRVWFAGDAYNAPYMGSCVLFNSLVSFAVHLSLKLIVRVLSSLTRVSVLTGSVAGAYISGQEAADEILSPIEY
jgi:hypothetical protein